MVWVPDPHSSLAANHERLLAAPDIETYMGNLDRTVRPSVLIIGCTDCRMALNNLFNLSAGQGFIHKQVGGFVAENMEGTPIIRGTFAVATGMNEILNIVLVTHSDCAAAKVAQMYPNGGDIPADVQFAPYLRVIQDCVLRVSPDIPRYAKKFNQRANQGHALPAADMMAVQLGICSLQNMMKATLYENMATTVGEMVARGEVCITLLHFDLGQKDQAGRWARIPAIYRYNPHTNRYMVQHRLSGGGGLIVPEGHEACGCHMNS